MLARRVQTQHSASSAGCGSRGELPCIVSLYLNFTIFLKKRMSPHTLRHSFAVPLPVPILSRLFRGMMLKLLKAAHGRGRLQFFGLHTALTDKAGV
jgi:hypothetical protein